MTSILALRVCPASGQQCQPMIGEQMQFAECLMTGQTKAADFINRNHGASTQEVFLCGASSVSGDSRKDDGTTASGCWQTESAS
ncbi:hypothetical protein [Mesorhizobium muleiense]|uniref:hypothetical protein n=1 Tax=Mesorhizobium muleiense TaxID=1004279 RepID=UPI001F363904|nr:hypothetical protein [Mesorhizobium muleiense]MCF6110949.1 hypothetical protein [Mesorhizobium muleiense]